MLDYESSHYCPAYDKTITADLCYDSLCCLTGMFKIESTPELAEIDDVDRARTICKACEYSNLEGGVDEWDGYIE